MRKPRPRGATSLQTAGRPREGTRGWGLPDPGRAWHSPAPLYLLSIEVGLGLDGAEVGQGSGWPLCPVVQGANGWEQSQEECSPGGQHDGGGNHNGAGEG